MERYRHNPFTLDDLPVQDGDTSFVGVNMKLDPDKLPPGFASLAINKVMRTKGAPPRGGIVSVVSHNPRLLLRTLANVDYLVVTYTWDAGNGTTLGVNGLILVSPDLVAGQVNIGWGGAVVAPSSGTPELSLAPVIGGIGGAPTAGTVQVLINLKKIRDAHATGTMEYQLSSQWIGRSQSGGGDCEVVMSFAAWQGGTMALDAFNASFVNTGGVLQQTETRPVVLYTDNTGGTSQGRELNVTITAECTDLAVRLAFPAEPPFAGQVGQTGYVATAPLGPWTIWGSGIYADQNKDEWLLLAMPGGVWLVADGRVPSLVPVPAPLAGPVEFTQFVDTLILWMGEGVTPLVWDGIAPAGFTAAPQSTTSAETLPIPGAVTAEVLGINRMLIPVLQDQLLFTDILVYAQYDPALADFSARKGTDDVVVRVFPFVQGQIIVFKSRSISLLTNVTADLSAMQLEDVNRELGLVARKAVCWVGADVWFLSNNGVYSVQQIVQDRFFTDPVPASDPIAPVFRERVNWPAAAGAVAAVLEEYYWLAVPIDGSTVNNALLCYNTTSQNWEGWHTFPAGVEITDLQTVKWNGRRRLFAIDRTRGYIYLMEEGPVDRVGDNRYAITDRLTTRGYTCGTYDFKDFVRAEVNVGTWNPTYSISVDFDGVNETVQAVANRTRSNTASFLFGNPGWVPDNSNDDHGAPKRQDYSVSLATPFELRSGIAFGLTQIIPERFAIRRRAKWMTVDIQSTGGICEGLQVNVEARVEERSNVATV